MADIPSSMRAVVVQSAGSVSVREVPVPVLAAHEVLVIAIAQNPTDWKHVDFVSSPGVIIGCDFSGVVVQLGSSVQGSVKIGDHVAGFVQGGHWPDRGAFAEYVKTDATLVWAVPPNTYSHEEAAAINVGLWTAAQAFYHPKRLGLVEPPAKVNKDEWVFIYGGSTSVGQYAVQLAHISGYKVVTVASPHNHSLLKELGADIVFDYKKPDVIEDILKATNSSIHYALDTVSEKGSLLFTIKALGPGPGTVVCLLQPEEEGVNYRSDIKVIPTLLYTALGREFVLFTRYPKSEEDQAQMEAFLPKLSDLVRNNSIRVNRLKLLPGGLDGVQDGLEYMRKGNISAEKIVYRVAP